MRIYAIGDIHGSLDKLRNLLARCEHDAAGAPMRLVFVGDYIDRGPDSRGVIEHVMALQERLADSVVALMGNHEAMALAAIDETMPAGPGSLKGALRRCSAMALSAHARCRTRM
jgi:calcineurin-like phosphoesterase family protein